MPAFRALILLLTLVPALAAQNKPPIRALTAFVHLDTAQVEVQIRETVAILHDAQRAYERRGYEVQTIRITTQPLPELLKGLTENDAGQFLRSLNGLAVREAFIPNIGLATSAEADQLARILAANDQLESSILVAENEGIHWPAITAAAHVVKYLAEHTPHSDGNFRFVATALLGPYGPFFPGSYHRGTGRQFSLGLESANLVEHALAAHPRDIAAAENALAAELARYATECEQIAREIEKRSGWTYAGLDPTPAPAGDISIADAIEKFTGSRFGSSGTMTAAAMITRAVKSVPVKQVGYAGLMVPVLEDGRLARRWSEGAFHIDSLLAYSAVCGTGFDTVPLPGEISEDQLARIIGDMASLAFKWKKPLSARLLPVAGKKPGDKTEFHNPHLVDAVLQPLP
ncbi:MAG TPA: DUF711 family protein [Terriglobales bacterium]|nr:DUF711 family protein [Terriglobales bacterium]